MVRKFLPLALILVLSAVSLAQSPDESRSDDGRADVRKNAAALLRETSQLIGYLRTVENRVNANVRTADALWWLDERQSRAMFEESMADIARYIARIDAEMNAAASAPASGWPGAVPAREYRRRSNRVVNLRASIINMVAERDAELALRFFRETAGLVTSPELIRSYERSNSRLERTIERKMLANDVAKALETGREKLAKGVSSEVVGLALQIYSKDSDKGSAFADEIIEKLRTSRTANTWLLASLLQRGASIFDDISQAGSSKKPLLEENSLKEIALMLADGILSSSNRTSRLSDSALASLDRFVPSKSAEVRRVLEQRRSAASRGQGNSASRGRGERNAASQRFNEARAAAQKDINQIIGKIGDDSADAEQRRKVIDESRNRIMAVNNRDFQISNLISLAKEAERIGDAQTAQSILGEAEMLIARQPIDRNDFDKSRDLAVAFASVDPGRSFQIFENMAFGINEAVEGFIKFSSFTGNSRAVDNGELVMSSYSRQFTRFFNIPSVALYKLAASDFDRLKRLADKFSRPEIRIETRLNIAKTLLGETSGIRSTTPGRRRAAAQQN